MDFKDYYKILGVDSKASAAEIKAAYRALARSSHPDLNPGNPEAEKKFSEINEAYEVLNDEEKRKQFDEIADYVKTKGHPPRQEYAYEDSQEDSHSFFEQFFGRRHSRASQHPGADLHAEVEITLQEAFSGSTRRLSLSRQELCPPCHGSGVVDRRVCHACRGMGQVLTPYSLDVKIPAGVTEGSVIRLAGQGHPGSPGAPRGDLLLVIAVQPDPVYQVEGHDLHRDLEVSIFLALLGGEVQVEGLKGKLGLKIPPETQNGKVFRLRGQGLPRAGGKPAGDLYARVSLRIPTGLTPEMREKVRQIQEQLEKGR
ncbi:J domain-containing protein [bacterium]|nr:J domain-containing protein [bacterium]